MTSLNLASHLKSTVNSDSLILNFNMNFIDLYRRDGLLKLDQIFLDFLKEGNDELCARLQYARIHPDKIDRKNESALLIEIAPWIEDFIARLFDIVAEVNALSARHHELAPIYSCKRQFVQRRAMNKVTETEVSAVNGDELEKELTNILGAPFSELLFACKVTEWLENEIENEKYLKIALLYSAWALRTPAGRERNQNGILFKLPFKLNYLNLVPTVADNVAGYTIHHLQHLRRRDGFALTDTGINLAGALDEANYCIWCHEQEKDSCSKGLKEKSSVLAEIPSLKKVNLVFYWQVAH